MMMLITSSLPIVGCASSPNALASGSGAVSSSQDIRDLIEAARGAPAALCACAARSIWNSWGWSDAPASPLGQPVSSHPRERVRLSDEDVRFPAHQPRYFPIRAYASSRCASSHP
jgi:hypothetical protein